MKTKVFKISEQFRLKKLFYPKFREIINDLNKVKNKRIQKMQEKKNYENKKIKIKNTRQFFYNTLNIFLS